MSPQEIGDQRMRRPLFNRPALYGREGQAFGIPEIALPLDRRCRLL